VAALLLLLLLLLLLPQERFTTRLPNTAVSRQQKFQ
jgi:hypothetical protein